MPHSGSTFNTVTMYIIFETNILNQIFKDPWGL